MNILLVNPPIRTWDNPHIYPVGLAYIAASLIQEGHRVEALDINGHRWSEADVQDIIKHRINEFDAVGIGGLITTYKYVKWLISVIKKERAEIPVIVGDNGATFSYPLYLEKVGADIAVIGEGDITIKEVAAAIKNKRDFNSVKGIALKQDGRIITTSPRERIEDLDGLPYPARDLFPLEKYITYSMPRQFGMRFLPISATRGCPFRCRFCYPSLGRVVKLRSARSIVDEIKFVKEKYNLECILFNDDLFIIDRKRTLEFCRLIREEEVDIKWAASARVDLVDEELLTAMKEGGCYHVGYGIESANPGVLAAMNKGFTIEQARKAVRLTKKVGLFCSTFWIIGWPNETPKSVKDTVKFIMEENLPFMGLNYATPYPDCQLYEEFMRSGRIKDEEAFIMKLGDARNFVVNLTSMPDKQLKGLKERICKALGENYGPFTGRLLRACRNNVVRHLIMFIWFLRFWGVVPAIRRTIIFLSFKRRDKNGKA